MKAYKITVLVLDFENLGMKDAMLCLSQSRVECQPMYGEERDIGEWSDDNPLNRHDKAEAEMNRLFGPDFTRGELVGWAEKDGDEWIVYGADSDTGKHISQYQKKSHFVDVFPIYKPADPLADVSSTSLIYLRDVLGAAAGPITISADQARALHHAMTTGRPA